MNNQTAFRSQIRDLLNETYNESELRSLVFDLDIDYDNLPGNTKDDKARELIRYCETRNKVNALLAAIQRERPEIASKLTPPPNQLQQSLSSRHAKWIRVSIILFVIAMASALGIRHYLRPKAPPSDDMVFVKEGYFTMGNDQGEPDQQPVRKVYQDSYWIDRFEVTNQQYQEFVIAESQRIPDHWQNGHYPSGYDDHPVVGISWFDADAYCRFVGKRLPTESEWEKAARGTEGLLWPWGNLWEDERANTLEAGIGNTLPVGSYKAGVSRFDAYDMAGNAWEWVDDWYGENAYASAQDRNPHNSIPLGANPTKVIRGGSWIEDRIMAQTCYRLGIYPPEYPPEVPEELTNPISYIGFRCACDNCRK